MGKSNFTIAFKRSDFKKIDAVSLMMCFFAVVIFTYSALKKDTQPLPDYLVSVLIIGWCIFNLRQKNKNDFTVSYGVPLFLSSAALFLLVRDAAHYFFAAFFFIAALLDKQVRIPLKVTVDEEGILFNSFIKKKSTWNELNNVLIKDGLITVDYKSNKLFQKDIEEEISIDLEKEFNEFCHKQISVLKDPQIEQ